MMEYDDDCFNPVVNMPFGTALTNKGDVITYKFCERQRWRRITVYIMYDLGR